MISEAVFWKARTFVKRGEVKLIGAHHGHLEFSVNGHTVFKNGKTKSWSCCASTKGKDKMMTGCILFGKGKTCSHILACKMFLRGKDLE